MAGGKDGEKLWAELEKVADDIQAILRKTKEVGRPKNAAGLVRNYIRGPMKKNLRAAVTDRDDKMEK